MVHIAMDRFGFVVPAEVGREVPHHVRVLLLGRGTPEGGTLAQRDADSWHRNYR